MGNKWIFKMKEGIPGVDPPRYKERLVAKGIHRENEWILMKSSLLW